MAFRFEGLEIWQLAKAYAGRICAMTVQFPRKEDYALTSQLNRAAYSVVLNIAEGSGRDTDAEFNHFLSIAVGSVFEVVGGLHLARQQNYIDEKPLPVSTKMVTNWHVKSMRSATHSMCPSVKPGAISDRQCAISDTQNQGGIRTSHDERF
jgi:four helix bundle protein